MASRKARSEIGKQYGVNYRLVYDQNYILGGFEPPLEWSWFLFINGDFEGQFLTKKSAIKHLGSIYA